jgi:hypothetical protein
VKITPRDALDVATAALGDRTEAEQFLLVWLFAGKIKADAAITRKSNGTTAAEKKLPTAVWENFKDNCPQSLWLTGSASHEGDEFVGIRFDKAQVLGVLRDHAPNTLPSTEKRTSNAGRYSGFNGEVIASLTVDLLKMDPQAYDKLTVRSIQKLLEQSYSKTKAAVPSERNLASIAKGIIKVVNENRGLLS